MRRLTVTKSFIHTAAFALLALGGTAQAAMPILYEETYANHEEARIIQFPIAGIHNSLWYDYRIGVNEAQKELASDLRHSDDIEDRRDAWEEYTHELAKGRKHYVRKMAKKGYRMGQVIVG
jgi:hypothetical protein